MERYGKNFCIYFRSVWYALEKLKYPINAVLLLIVLDTGCGTDDLQGPTNTSDAPTHLVAIPISQSEVELSWKDNSAVENGFIVQRKPGYQGTYQVIAKTGPDVTIYSDKGLNNLKPGTTYYYRVAYYKGSEISDYSNADDATTLKKVLALNKSSGFLTPQGDILYNDNEDENSVTRKHGKTVRQEENSSLQHPMKILPLNATEQTMVLFFQLMAL